MVQPVIPLCTAEFTNARFKSLLQIRIIRKWLWNQTSHMNPQWPRNRQHIHIHQPFFVQLHATCSYMRVYPYRYTFLSKRADCCLKDLRTLFWISRFWVSNFNLSKKSCYIYFRQCTALRLGIAEGIDPVHTELHSPHYEVKQHREFFQNGWNIFQLKTKILEIFYERIFYLKLIVSAISGVIKQYINQVAIV